MEDETLVTGASKDSDIELNVNSNNVYNKKYHDPWTSKGVREMESQETPLVEGNGAGKIYKPPGRQGSASSSVPLTGVSKRKASVYHQEPHPATASFAISVFNLMNAILGSGILGLPYAMAQLGIVLFFNCSILALFSIHLLLKLCDQTNVKAYEKLGFIAFGLPGRIVAACCILLQNIGAMSSYLFIVKYELPNVIMTILGVEHGDGSWYYNGDILVVVVTCAVIVPLASLKNIGFLGYTSGFSISCMFFFTAVVVVKKFQITCPLFSEDLFTNATHAESVNTSMTNSLEEKATEMPDLAEQLNSTMKIVFETATSFMNIDSGHSNATVYENTEHILSPIEEKAFHIYKEVGPQQCEAEAFGMTDKWAYSIPTMTFSFVCHTAVLPIYAELKEPCASRMQNVSNTSISICFILYSLSALFGYLTFYNWMEPELLLMYSYADSADILTLIVRVCVLVAVILTVPLTHFPARKAITFLIFPEKPFAWIRHLGIMVFLLTFINILVVFVPSILQVFGFIGATASTMLVFILPSIFYIRIDEVPIKESLEKKLSIALCTLGFIVMIQSLTVIIIGYAS
uniref:probable sodium-coupled neutral amino acid transporter 6 n=1 Tax=Styela clava TaxID=7725 RepID=UPI00193A4AE6|nr:probable sodium-coupled neutral amino acid transporter 6 [Styela clava]